MSTIRRANASSQLIPEEWVSIMVQLVQDEAVLRKARGRNKGNDGKDAEV